MLALIFDTETTGLPSERNALYTDYEKWPYIIQLSFILYDTTLRKSITTQDFIINIPDNVEISPESVSIHGITRTISKRKGVSIQLAMEEFQDYLSVADIIVCHNIAFDKAMILSTCCREKIPHNFASKGIYKSEYCTMKRTTSLCAIPVKGRKGDTYFKYPTLTELHKKLFGTIPLGTHDSMADVLICLRCYIYIEHGHDIAKHSQNSLKKLYKLYCCP